MSTSVHSLPGGSSRNWRTHCASRRSTPYHLHPSSRSPPHFWLSQSHCTATAETANRLVLSWISDHWSKVCRPPKLHVLPFSELLWEMARVVVLTVGSPLRNVPPKTVLSPSILSSAPIQPLDLWNSKISKPLPSIWSTSFQLNVSFPQAIPCWNVNVHDKSAGTPSPTENHWLILRFLESRDLNVCLDFHCQLDALSVQHSRLQGAQSVVSMTESISCFLPQYPRVWTSHWKVHQLHCQGLFSTCLFPSSKCLETHPVVIQQSLIVLEEGHHIPQKWWKLSCPKDSLDPRTPYQLSLFVFELEKNCQQSVLPFWDLNVTSMSMSNWAKIEVIHETPRKNNLSNIVSLTGEVKKDHISISILASTIHCQTIEIRSIRRNDALWLKNTSDVRHIRPFPPSFGHVLFLRLARAAGASTQDASCFKFHVVPAVQHGRRIIGGSAGYVNCTRFMRKYFAGSQRSSRAEIVPKPVKNSWTPSTSHSTWTPRTHSWDEERCVLFGLR